MVKVYLLLGDETMVAQRISWKKELEWLLIIMQDGLQKENESLEVFISYLTGKSMNQEFLRL